MLLQELRRSSNEVEDENYKKWITKLTKTVSIFNINVEEEVMKIMIVKMKASFSPSAVYSRMKIGELDHTLEITERNILRIRKESVFFRICWELLGCYDTVKPYGEAPEGGYLLWW